MDVDQILEALKAIIDAAEGRSLTDEEVTNYEKLEAQLATAQRSQQIRARQLAYQTPVNGGHLAHIGAVRQDNGLEQAFNAYLRTGQGNQDIAGLRVTNAQGEGTGAAGGYTVPDGFRQKLVDVQKKFGGFASEVDTFSTGNGQPIEYPSIDDTANVGGITAESAAITSGNDLVFGTVTLGAYKYTSTGAGSNLPLRVPVELLQDSAFDIAALVARKLGERIARAQAAHWITGTGSGQPKGIAAVALTADVEFDTPDTLVYKDLVDTQLALDEAYDDGARWLMSKTVWGKIRQIVDVNGRPIVQDSTAGIAGIPTKMLLGHEVVTDNGMADYSSAADTFPVLYGDFREAYVIRRVSDVAVVVNPYSRASNGEVEYTAWERADGNIQNRLAYTILANNT